MDWIKKHRANMDYFTKNNDLKCPKENEIEFRGQRQVDAKLYHFSWVCKENIQERMCYLSNLCD